MWQRGNAPAYKDKGQCQWFESGQDLFFSQAEKCPRFKKSCLSAFFVDLITAAPNLPKIWAFLLEFSGFGLVIKFQEILPIFGFFFHAVH